MENVKPIPEGVSFLFGYGYAILGSILGLVGIALGTWSLSQGLGTEQTPGTVVTLEYRTGGDGFAYVPVVAYQVAGTSFRCTGGVAFDPPMHKIGERVTVKLAQPSVGYIDSFVDRWLLPTLFTGIGGLFAVVGCGILLWRRKRASRN